LSASDTEPIIGISAALMEPIEASAEEDELDPEPLPVLVTVDVEFVVAVVLAVALAVGDVTFMAMGVVTFV
jgi:hypothetical protein